MSSNCVVCGQPYAEEHHVFFGTGLRKISEKHNFKVRLCYAHHRQQPTGVHGGNKQLDLELKVKCQFEYEKTHTRAEWLKLIGRNYIED